MKRSTIQHYHGNLVRKSIPSRNYDVIFSIRRLSKPITKNKFRLSLNKHNAILSYFSFQQRSADHKYFTLYDRFHNYRYMPIFDYSICKFNDNTLKELRMAKDYFDRNYRRR